MTIQHIAALVCLYVGSIRDLEEELSTEDMCYAEHPDWDDRMTQLNQAFDDNLSPKLNNRIGEIITGMYQEGYADYFSEQDVLTYLGV